MSDSKEFIAETKEDVGQPLTLDGGLSASQPISKKPTTSEDSSNGNDYNLLLQMRGLEYEKDLGKGSCGVVIQVLHKKDQCRYAVKILKDDRDEKYKQRELDLLKKQTHDNIVRYYDCWEDLETNPHTLCIRMERCDTSLENLLQENKNIVDSPTFYQHVFPQILRGLEYIHNKHWVHRDLYPANILMMTEIPNVQSWVVKLADFGYAREIHSPLTHSDPPKDLSVVGNELYRAPEMSSKQYDYKVDMYSAGVVLYRLCCRFEDDHKLIEKLEHIKAAQMINEERLSDLSHRDQLLLWLLENLVNSDPKKRPIASDALKRFSQLDYETDAVPVEHSDESNSDDYRYGIT